MTLTPLTWRTVAAAWACRGPITQHVPSTQHESEPRSLAALAFTTAAFTAVLFLLVIELVAGLAIGFGMGYGIDRLLGTLPVFLVIFIFLGLAAGIKTMLRSARELDAKRAGASQGPSAQGPED